MNNKPILLIILLVLAVVVLPAAGQTNDFEALSATPKNNKTFPAGYKIALPGADFKNWDHDFEVYFKFLTPALRKTQATMSYEDKGVQTMINPNSIMPHAQLDTATMLKDETVLNGTWRMLSFRSIRFNDSADIPARTIYRAADTVLEDKSKDEAFAIFEKGKFRMHVREEGKNSFKKELSSSYKIESSRYLMLYKFFKSASGVSQVGIDENGYLIINYPSVIEHVKKGNYISYYAVIRQVIFEKVKE